MYFETDHETVTVVPFSIGIHVQQIYKNTILSYFKLR